MSTQICKTCNQDKLLSHFSVRSDTKKYRTQCKSCRNQKQQKYSKTEAGKLTQKNADQKRNVMFPERRAARSATFHALKIGKLTELPCIICGNKAEAHHPDYSRPLDVVWLCKPHHKETHSIIRGKNEQ